MICISKGYTWTGNYDKCGRSEAGDQKTKGGEGKEEGREMKRKKRKSKCWKEERKE